MAYVGLETEKGLDSQLRGTQMHVSAFTSVQAYVLYDLLIR